MCRELDPFSSAAHGRLPASEPEVSPAPSRLCLPEAVRSSLTNRAQFISWEGGDARKML